MKLFYFFTATLLITASQQYHAMQTDKSTPANILMELTHVKKPWLVACLPDNLVAIIGENGCSLCDYTTGTEIEKVCITTQKVCITTPYWCAPYLTAHPNGKVLVLGNYCTDSKNQKKDLIVYDITTKEIWKKELSISNQPVFNPLDDTIFIQEDYGRKTTIFNYKNKSHEPYSLKLLPKYLRLNEFHPTQQNLCLSCNSGTISILTWYNNAFTKATPILQVEAPIIEECTYSPDGSLIAILTGRRECHIFNLQSQLQKKLLNNDSHIWAMVFHPTSFILATLSNHPHSVHYWNAQTQQLITTTPLTFSKSTFYGGNRMDFTRNGEILFIALENTCIGVEVPFEVRYKDMTKNNAIFTYWILKNYQQHHDNIPNEIIHLLTNKLLETSQYSLTNY